MRRLPIKSSSVSARAIPMLQHEWLVCGSEQLEAAGVRCASVELVVVLLFLRHRCSCCECTLSLRQLLLDCFGGLVMFDEAGRWSVGVKKLRLRQSLQMSYPCLVNSLRRLLPSPVSQKASPTAFFWESRGSDISLLVSHFHRPP